MHSQTLQKWQHSHDFSTHDAKGETRTFQVLILTAITMVIEIIAGYTYGSMALLADGWHMGTHVAAFAITLFAYQYARRYATSEKFSFGTGKVNVLGGFASAIALAVVALMIGLESMQRLFSPHEIQFNEAIIVAILGLLVNLASAWLLQGSGHDHHHHHGHAHGHHDHHHHDHNLKAAYFHVLADALTSVLAIVALLIGKYSGITWVDSAMGLVGMVIIMRWAYGLLQESSGILLDHSVEDTKQKIKETIEADSDNRIADLHVWRVSPNNNAAIISLVTHEPKSSIYYKSLLHDFHLSHVSIEVIPCEGGCQT
ncbi:CDF family Co(II)/Ni(II) efflux transporter DmeF [Candidatus Albibeggiatoa sp. nov. NOAA]|uniref:CDF family Co(II)/Ni(II) efflux transporter DmeF n=1 Tax=Candidatus Albibeggiatoa sp. nov. NOAA TaxID=3162724 RepID=UPI0032FCB775|nr:CDF family Co(II)/Ni(II) efflux transporter DmeF [Thiotrichaceae bacterium]